MTFQIILAHVITWLQREQRVSYRALKWQCALDDAYREDLKGELIYAKKFAVDEAGRVLASALASCIPCCTRYQPTLLSGSRPRPGACMIRS